MNRWEIIITFINIATIKFFIYSTSIMDSIRFRVILGGAVMEHKHAGLIHINTLKNWIAIHTYLFMCACKVLFHAWKIWGREKMFPKLLYQRSFKNYTSYLCYFDIFCNWKFFFALWQYFKYFCTSGIQNILMAFRK